MASEYVVVVTCDDCTGIDPMGCGDGKPWTLGPFATREEADAAGDLEADGASPWRYRVVAREDGQ